MPAAAWTIPCAHRLWGSNSTGSGESHTTRRQIMNGTGYWTRTADISKTGIKCIRGDRILLLPPSRSGRTVGTTRPRSWYYTSSSFRNVYLGFRPVLEVLNPDTLGSDGMKAVTLDLNGGKLGGSSEDIQIIVKSSESFAAPASDGLTRPDGDTGSYFMWLGSDGKFYAPRRQCSGGCYQAHGAVCFIRTVFPQTGRHLLL